MAVCLTAYFITGTCKYAITSRDALTHLFNGINAVAFLNWEKFLLSLYKV